MKKFIQASSTDLLNMQPSQTEKRGQKWKTTIRSYTLDNVSSAVHLIMKNNYSIQQTAKRFVPHCAGE